MHAKNSVSLAVLELLPFNPQKLMGSRDPGHVPFSEICLSPGVECSLYVDDFLICYRSKFIHIIERHLQRSLNKLQHWILMVSSSHLLRQSVYTSAAFVRRILIHS